MNGPITLFLWHGESRFADNVCAISLETVQCAVWGLNEAGAKHLRIWCSGDPKPVSMSEDHGERFIRELIQFHELMRGGSRSRS